MYMEEQRLNNCQNILEKGQGEGDRREQSWKISNVSSNYRNGDCNIDMGIDKFTNRAKCATLIYGSTDTAEQLKGNIFQ